MDNTILEDLISALLGKGMNQVQDGLGGFAPLLMRLVKDHIPGISGSDPLWDARVTSSKTNYGNYMDRLQSQIQQAARGSMAPVINNSKQQYFESIQRTLVSEDRYNKMRAANGGVGMGSSYDDYIHSKASGSMDNMIWSSIYNFMDPADTEKMSQEMGRAYSNIAKPGVLRGDRRALSSATEIIRGMLPDGVFRSEDFSGMSGAAVGRLTSEVTKDANILESVDASNPEQLRQASTKLRDKVKGLATALRPLRDLFGEDVPGMIDTVQQLTGMPIANIETSRLSKLSGNLATRFASGRYDAGLLSQTQGGVRQMMDVMGVRGVDKLAATEQSMRILDVTKGGFNANFIDKQDADKYTTSYLLKSMNSDAADAMAKGYSIWKERGMAGVNAEVEAMTRRSGESEEAFAKRKEEARRAKRARYTTSTFMAEIRKKADDTAKRTGQDIDMTGAMLDTLGFVSPTQLSEGEAYSGYMEGKFSRDIGLGVTRQNMENDKRHIIQEMAVDEGLRTALGTVSGGKVTQASTEEAQTQLENAFKLMAVNPNLMNMSQDELHRTLTDMASNNGSKELTRLSADGTKIGAGIRGSDIDASKLTRTISMLKIRDPKQLQLIGKMQDESKMQALTARSERNRAAASALKEKVAKNPKELVQRMLDTGLDSNAVLSYLYQGTETDMNGVTPEEQEMSKALATGFTLNARKNAERAIRARYDSEKIYGTDGKGKDREKIGTFEQWRKQNSSFIEKAYSAAMNDAAEQQYYGMTDVKALSNENYTAISDEQVRLRAQLNNPKISKDRKAAIEEQMARNGAKLGTIKAMRADTLDRFIKDNFGSTIETTDEWQGKVPGADASAEERQAYTDWVKEQQADKVEVDQRNAIRKAGGDVDAYLAGYVGTEKQKVKIRSQLELRGYKFKPDANETGSQLEARIAHNKRVTQTEAAARAHQRGEMPETITKAALASTKDWVKDGDDSKKSEAQKLVEGYWKSAEFGKDGLNATSWNAYIQRQREAVAATSEKGADGKVDEKKKASNAARLRDIEKAQEMFSSAYKGVDTNSSMNLSHWIGVFFDKIARGLGFVEQIADNTAPSNKPGNQQGKAGQPPPGTVNG